MSEEIVIKLEAEGEETATAQVESVVESALEGAVAIVEVASALADQMNEGSDDFEFEVLGRLDSLFNRFDSLFQLVGDLSIKIDSLTALEVAEVVVDNTTSEVEEIAATAAVIEATNEVPAEMPSEPELRKTTKRKWI